MDKTVVGGGAHQNERRVAAKVNRVRKSSRHNAERMGWERERVDRLLTERHPAFGIARD